MSVASQSLREERNPLYTKIRELSDKINAEKRDFTAEEKGEWEKVNNDYDALTRRIEITEKAEQAEHDVREAAGDREIGRGAASGKRNAKSATDRRQKPTAEDRDVALAGWMRRQMDLPVTKRQAEACQRTGIRPSQRNFVINLRVGRAANSIAEYESRMQAVRERRDLSAINALKGGATVAEGFVNNLEVNLLAYGGMRQVSEIIRTSQGNEMPWPTADDASNEGELLGESQDSSTNTADPSFGSVRFQAHKFSSKMIKVPVELLEDSSFDLASQLGSWIGERLGRIGNRKQTVGTGGNEPKGLVTAATAGVTAASATAIVFDELIDLEHSIDPAYRDATCGYMMHDSIVKLLRKLKDGEGRYIWQMGRASGEADTINTYPLTVNQHMATIAASAKTVLFGQFKKYKIREVAQIRLRRLVERYAEKDQEGFVAFQRMDGNLLDAGTHPVKYLIQAA